MLREVPVYLSIFPLQKVNYSHRRLTNVISKFSVESNFKFCRGIDPQIYKSHYLEAMRFNIKSVRQAVEPFARVVDDGSSWPAMPLVC